MNMTSKNVYRILLGVVVLLLVTLPASAYKIDGLLASRSQVKLKAKSAALDQEQIDFEIAKQNIKQYANLEKTAKTIVPQDKNQAEAVREIVNIAAKNGVDIGSIAFPPSTLGGSSVSSGSGVSSSSGAQSTSSSSSSTANTNSAQNKLSQLTVVSGIPGVYQLPITVTGNSKSPILYGQLINFLSDLEHNRRTAQVNSINISPVGNGRYLTFDIVLNEYIKP